MGTQSLGLSPSKIAAYEECPRQYYFKYVLKVKPEHEGANLGFGSALHAGVEAFLRSVVTGVHVDPVAVFRDAWTTFTDQNEVLYSSIWSRDKFFATGERLMSLFPNAWRESGYVVALDADSEPLIERNLKIDVGDNVMLWCKIDLVAINQDGQMIVIDIKGSAQPSSTVFKQLSDQLSAYQVAVSAHRQALGVEGIDGVTFWEMIKRNIPKTNRGEGPVIISPEVVPSRSPTAIGEYLLKIGQVARRIRAEEFPRTPRMAYNTPCGLCPYADACAYGDTSGLAVPSAKVEMQIARMAA